MTLPIKRKLFGDFDDLLVLKRDGSIGYDYEYLKNKTPTPEQKPEPSQSIITQQELN